jgi:hypothetical protein
MRGGSQLSPFSYAPPAHLTNKQTNEKAWRYFLQNSSQVPSRLAFQHPETLQVELKEPIVAVKSKKGFFKSGINGSNVKDESGRQLKLTYIEANVIDFSSKILNICFVIWIRDQWTYWFLKDWRMTCGRSQKRQIDVSVTTYTVS